MAAINRGGQTSAYIRMMNDLEERKKKKQQEEERKAKAAEGKNHIDIAKEHAIALNNEHFQRLDNMRRAQRIVTNYAAQRTNPAPWAPGGKLQQMQQDPKLGGTQKTVTWTPQMVNNLMDPKSKVNQLIGKLPKEQQDYFNGVKTDIQAQMNAQKKTQTKADALLKPQSGSDRMQKKQAGTQALMADAAAAGKKAEKKDIWTGFGALKAEEPKAAWEGRPKDYAEHKEEYDRQLWDSMHGAGAYDAMDRRSVNWNRMNNEIEREWQLREARAQAKAASGKPFNEQSAQAQKENQASGMNSAYAQFNDRNKKMLDAASGYSAAEYVLGQAYGNLGNWMGGPTQEYLMAMNPKNARAIMEATEKARLAGLGNGTNDVETMDATGRNNKRFAISFENKKLEEQIKGLKKEQEELIKKQQDLNVMKSGYQYGPTDIVFRYGEEYRDAYEKYLRENNLEGNDQVFAQFIIDESQKEYDALDSRLKYAEAQLQGNNDLVDQMDRLDEMDNMRDAMLDPNARKAKKEQLTAEITALEDQLAANNASGAPFAQRDIERKKIEKQLNTKREQLALLDNLALLDDDVEDDATFHSEWDRGQNWEEEEAKKYNIVKGKKVYSRSYKGPQAEASIHGVYSYINGGNEYEYYSKFDDRQIDAQYQGAMAMLPEEIEQFNKLYNDAMSNGREPVEAQAFLDALQPYLNQRLRTFEELHNRQMARTNPISTSIASAENTMLSLPMAAATMIGRATGAKWTEDPYSGGFALARYQGDVEDQVAKDLGDTGGFFYKAGMSAVKNFLRGLPFAGASAALGAAGTLTEFFGEAYYTSYQQKLEQTGNPDEAGVYAFTDAAISTFFEIASVEKMFSDPTDLLQYLLQVGGAEMSEEFFEGVFSPYIHELIDGSNEWKDNAVKMIQDGGYEDEDGNWVEITEENANLAYKKALQDYNNQVAESVLSAGISTLGPAGFGIIRRNVQQNNETRDIGKTILNKNVTKGMKATQAAGERFDAMRKLTEAAQQMPAGSESRKVAEEMAEDARNGRKISFKKAGKLVGAIMQESNEQIGQVAEGVLADTIQQRLMDSGMESDAAGKMSMVLKDAMTRGNSPMAWMIISQDEEARKIWNEFNEKEEVKTARQAQKSVLEMLPDARAEQAAKNIKADAAARMAVAKYVTEKDEELQEALAAGGQRTGSALEVVADGKIADVAGFGVRENTNADGVKSWTVTVRLSNGEEVDIDQVKSTNEAGAKVLTYMEGEKGQSIGDHAGIALIRMGGKVKDLAAAVADTQALIWEAYTGRAAKLTGVSEDQGKELRAAVAEDMKAADKRAAENRKELKPGQSAVTMNGVAFGTQAFTQQLEKLGAKVRDEANFVAGMLKAIGMDAEFYYDNSKEGTAEQGSFVGGQGIKINLAGTFTEDGVHRSVIATVDHEATHWLRANSPEAFRDLSKFVLNKLSGTFNLQDEIKRISDNYAHYGEHLTMDGAIEEMVAMSCEQVLTDEQLVDELQEEDPTLYGKVKDAIRRVVVKITKELETDTKLTSSRYARAMEGSIRELAGIWKITYEAAKGATENANREKVNIEKITQRKANEILEKSGEIAYAPVKYSFAGERAEGKYGEDVRKAFKMEKEGATDEQIREATNCIRGFNGRWWRILDNNNMKLKIAPENIEKGKNNRLADVYDAEELYKAYPNVQYARIVFDNYEENFIGASKMAGYFCEINLNTKIERSAEEYEATIQHEAQHLIQLIEKSNNGANVTFWKDMQDIARARIANNDRQINKLLQKVGINERTELAWGIEFNPDGTIDEEYLFPEELEKVRKMPEEDLKQYKALDEDNKKWLKLLEGNPSPMTLYRNTVGEIEARAASEKTGKNTKIKYPYNAVTTEEFTGQKVSEPGETVKYSMRDEDREYLSVVKMGRYDLAEKMVDEAAKKAGYTIKAYHGTPNGKFNTFEKFKIGTTTDFGKLGRGFYFTNKKQVADYYAGYLNDSTVMPVYLKMDNPFVLNRNYDNMSVKEFYDSILGKGGIVDEQRSEELTQWLIDNGYDGIVADGEYMVLDPKNIKSAETVTYDKYGEVIPLSERFRTDHEENWKDIDIRFSMREPVEERADGLIALHNLEEAQLLKTLQLGGFAMPSIAVIKSSAGHSKYGPISVVFKPSTIDPKASKSNKVYGGDAWTPTYPSVEYKINSKKLYKLVDKIEQLVPREVLNGIQMNSLDEKNTEDAINSARGDYVKALKNNFKLKLAYLADKGINIEYPMQEQKLSRRFSNDQIRQIIEVLGEEKIREANESGSGYLDEHPEIAETMRKIKADEWEKEIREKIDTKDTVLKMLKMNPYSKEEWGFSQTNDGLYGAIQYMNRGVRQEVDEKALKEIVDQNLDEAGYEEWLRQELDGIIEKKGIRNNKNYYTDYGNPRSWEQLHDEETLENVVRIMKAEADKGSNSFFSQSEMLAIGTRDFKSLEDIRKHSGQLRMMDDEEYKATKEKIVSGFGQLMDEMSDKSERNYLIARDRALEAMVDAVRRTRNPAGIERELRQWNGLNVREGMGQEIADLLEQIADLPTGYFEAKPKRAVYFDEIEKVIIPETASIELTNAMDQRGIPYDTYDGTEEDRLRVLNEQENAMFSIRDDTDYDVRQWMETVPEWSLQTEAEKKLLGKYKDMQMKQRLDRERMRKIDRELLNLEAQLTEERTGRVEAEETMENALESAGVSVRDGHWLQKDGKIVGKINADGTISMNKGAPESVYQDLRKAGFGFTKRNGTFRPAMNAPQNADGKPAVQAMLGKSEAMRQRDALRIRKQNLQQVMDQQEEKLAEITQDEGFGKMMYQQQKVLDDLQNFGTQQELVDYVARMEKKAREIAARIEKNRKAAEELEKGGIVGQFRKLLGTTTAEQTAAELKKEYSSTWTAKQIRAYLDPIILKMKTGEDFSADVETLAGILVGSDSRNRYETLESLRGLTITLGKGAQKELKAQNSSLKEVRARLAGTGITVKYGERSTLEADIEDMRAEYPMIPELGDEKDALGNFLNWIDSMKSASAGMEFYDQRIAAAMAQITGKAAGAARGLYMPNDPKAQQQVMKIMDFVKGLSAETAAAQRTLAEIAEQMGEMQKAGMQATNRATTLMRDVNVAIDYYQKIGKIAADEAKQKKQSAVIEQLKSKHAEEIVKNNAEWRAQIQRDKDAREQLEENRKMTRQISTALKRTWNLLKNPKGLNNVPEYMQGLAREVISMFVNNDLGRGSRFLQATQEELAERLRVLEAWEQQNGKFDRNALTLDPENVKADVILADLDKITDALKVLNAYRIYGKNKLDVLRQRGEIIAQIRDGVSEIYSAIKAEQEVQIGDRRVAVEDAALAVAQGTNGKKYREWKGAAGQKIALLHKFIVSGNMTPEYFFRYLGNAGLSDLWDNYHDAENRNGLELKKAKDALAKIAEEYGYKNWDLKQKITLNLESGDVEITLGQMMSLWATWKREKTLGPEMSEHLTKGGFFAEVDLRDGILGREAVEKRAHTVTEEDMARAKDLLTEEQRKFVDAVVGFMSRDMSELGNEASMKAYGIRLYKEAYYFPFQIWNGVKSRKSNDAGSAAGTQDRAFHPSFSKSRMYGADNAVMIGDFMQVATDHIAGMINYATMGLANESLMKVLNQQTAEETYGTKRNTEAIIEEAYGREAMQYLRELQTQLNGGAVKTERSIGDKAISLFRKNAVAGSLSVALQQPLSYIRAAMMIDAKYLTQAVMKEYWKGSYQELVAHSGVAVIKDMGKWDMNAGASAREYLTPEGKESTGRMVWNTIGELATMLPNKMDAWTWTRMWVAVKAEQHELHPEMDMKSDRFLDMCGVRFNDIMRRTQVYDSTLVRSANMRSQNYFMKGITSFMAEPTLTINVLADAVRMAKNREKGGMKMVGKAVATFSLSAVLQAAVKGLMGSGRNPDEKKTWLENFLYRFWMNLLGEANPFGLIPGYSDMVTLLKDGELSDDAMGAIGKIWTATKGTVNLLLNGPGEKGLARDLEDTVGQLVQIFTNIPMKNLMRDTRAMANFITQQPYAKRPTSLAVLKYQMEQAQMNTDTLVSALLQDAGFKVTNQAYFQRIYQAKKAGNEQAAQDMIEYLLKGKGVKQERIDSGVMSAAKSDENLSVDEKAEVLGGDDATWWKLDRDAYKKETGKAVGSTSYYYRLEDAINGGGTDEIRTAVKLLQEHGIDNERIRKQLSGYKKDYLALTGKEKIKLKNSLIMAYKAIGLKEAEAEEIINKWK